MIKNEWSIIQDQLVLNHFVPFLQRSDGLLQIFLENKRQNCNEIITAIPHRDENSYFSDSTWSLEALSTISVPFPPGIKVTYYHGDF